MKNANKGEWSEFYVFLKILCEQKLVYTSDPSLLSSDHVFRVLAIITNQKGCITTYSLRAPTSIEILQDNLPRKSLSISLIQEMLPIFFEQIQKKSPSKGAFPISDAEKIMTLLEYQRIKSPSTKKTDIILDIEDVLSAKIIRRGFSIKSNLGAKATLLNASLRTNFKYEVVSSGENILPGMNPKISLNKKLPPYSKLKFLEVVCPFFKRNLEYVDSQMPTILSGIIRLYYLGHPARIRDLTTLVAQEDPLKRDDDSFYQNKMQELLLAVALGLQPGKRWNGSQEITGGYIMVAKNGDIFCLDLEEKDQFKKFLFENTILETPSTKRHRFGEPYQEKDRLCIELNLQIRFNDCHIGIKHS